MTSVESYSKNFENVLDIAVQSFISEIFTTIPDLKSNHQELSDIWMTVKSKKSDKIKL